MNLALIKLTDIRCDSGTQCRSGVSEETVSDYADRMQSGDTFPPVVLFSDGNEYHMADGFHRCLAANRNGADELLAVIHQGTAQDALWYGLGSNRVNGLRLSPGDKRRAVELAIGRFPDKSQQEIADHVGCSQKYVSQMKADIIPRYNVPPTRKDSKGRNQPTSYKPKPAPSEVSPPMPLPAHPTVLPMNERTLDFQISRAALEIITLVRKKLSRPGVGSRQLLNMGLSLIREGKRLEALAAETQEAQP